MCYDGSECKSRLRILRLASCHYPVLRGFLNNVYLARSSHLKILKLDEAFSKGDFKFIMEACRIPIDSIFSNVVEGTQEGAAQECELRKPDLELRLQAENNKAIAEYRKAVEDYPKNVCCSCQELHQSKNVTVVKFDNHLGTAVWPLLKQFMLQKNPKAAGETHFMCSYCKNLIKKDQMPSRCVLNGLQVVEIPAELSRLDCLSKQFIQRAKAYQTVVQLGTYTAKVPMYNSLKACKGVMFFLPLPLEKTLDTFDEVDNNVSPASPELYIIVNGKPTKTKVVWRSLVDVNEIKKAVQKLKDINWLYKDVREDSVDEAVQDVVEVVKKTSSTVLEKATKEDISNLQCYTIRNLSTKQFTGDDIEQYKLMNVQEEPIDSRQKYLDVMCFPTLFPDGNFGKYHDRQKKISHSEYIKSRLLNKDSFQERPSLCLLPALAQGIERSVSWRVQLAQVSQGSTHVCK